MTVFPGMAPDVAEMLTRLGVPGVLSEKGPLLQAAARTFQRVKVETAYVQGESVARLFAPNGNQMADDAQVGDLVLVPNYGLWRMALVVAFDETTDKVWVACPDHAGPSLTYVASFPLEQPGIFPEQRKSLYWPGRLKHG